MKLSKWKVGLISLAYLIALIVAVNCFFGLLIAFDSEGLTIALGFAYAAILDLNPRLAVGEIVLVSTALAIARIRMSTWPHRTSLVAMLGLLATAVAFLGLIQAGYPLLAAAIHGIAPLALLVWIILFPSPATD